MSDYANILYTNTTCVFHGTRDDGHFEALGPLFCFSADVSNDIRYIPYTLQHQYRVRVSFERQTKQKSSTLVALHFGSKLVYLNA